jgi:hypothetical protein
LRYKDEQQINKYKIINLTIPAEKVLDIFPLENNKFCTLSEDNNLKIWEMKEEKKLSLKKTYENVNYFIPDLEKKINFLLLKITKK